jgi:DNA-binding transcriptional regulator YdaS (Cro superfamily)
MDLKTYIETEKIKGVKFAQMIGISPRYFYMILSGARTPSYRLAKVIHNITQGHILLGDLIPQKEKCKCPHCGKVMNKTLERKNVLRYK